MAPGSPWVVEGRLRLSSLESSSKLESPASEFMNCAHANSTSGTSATHHTWFVFWDVVRLRRSRIRCSVLSQSREQSLGSCPQPKETAWIWLCTSCATIVACFWSSLCPRPPNSSSTSNSSPLCPAGCKRKVSNAQTSTREIESANACPWTRSRRGAKKDVQAVLHPCSDAAHSTTRQQALSLDSTEFMLGTIAAKVLSAASWRRRQRIRNTGAA
mmetsp:Transcript_8823/g.54285  ORF Transcript_8823/g.54285 Transcript_8823/m.54285 type:complete len:215 (-) Transcript_8823:3190-3834(-)